MLIRTLGWHHGDLSLNGKHHWHGIDACKSGLEPTWRALCRRCAEAPTAAAVHVALGGRLRRRAARLHDHPQWPVRNATAVWLATSTAIG